MLDTIISLLVAAVLAGTPLLFGTIGEILAEKSGNLNLGVEGMMYMGAIAGIASVYFVETWLGGAVSGIACALVALLFSFLLGAFGAAIYSFLTITLRANQNVTGLTLTIFGTGFANFFGEAITMAAPNKIMAISTEAKATFANSSIFPFMEELAQDSQFFYYINKLFFSYNFMVYLGIILAILMAVFLKRTRFGLNLRAVGENPATADAAGINVNRYKYLATIIGGGICGIGGMYISMVTSNGVWIYGCVGGKGWIAVALVIFACWSPARALLGSLLFGGLSVLRMYIPMGIPLEIYDIFPYLFTILVLIITSIRQNKEHNMPKHCGFNYFREDR